MRDQAWIFAKKGKWADALGTVSGPGGLRLGRVRSWLRGAELVGAEDNARAFELAARLAASQRGSSLAAWLHGDNFSWAVFHRNAPVMAGDGGRLPAALLTALDECFTGARRTLRGDLLRGCELMDIEEGPALLQAYCAEAGEVVDGDEFLASDPLVVFDLLQKFGCEAPHPSDRDFEELWFDDESRQRYGRKDRVFTPGERLCLGIQLVEVVAVEGSQVRYVELTDTYRNLRTAEPTAQWRPLMTADEAESVLQAVTRPAAAAPADGDRRKLLKMRQHLAHETAPLAEVVHRYAGMLEEGKSLFTDEKVALREARSRLVAEAALALGCEERVIDERLRAAQR